MHFSSFKRVFTEVNKTAFWKGESPTLNSISKKPISTKVIIKFLFHISVLNNFILMEHIALKN